MLFLFFKLFIVKCYQNSRYISPFMFRKRLIAKQPFLFLYRKRIILFRIQYYNLFYAKVNSPFTILSQKERRRNAHLVTHLFCLFSILLKALLVSMKDPIFISFPLMVTFANILTVS
jgi:hypothetical protein